MFTDSEKGEDVVENLGETGNSSEADEKATKAPDGGYGWVVLGAVITIFAFTWGVNMTFGVYTSFFLENNYLEGGTPLRYSFVGGLSVAVALISAPLAAFLMKTFGFHVPLFLGSVATGLGQILAGISTTFSAYIVCQGVIFGLGVGITFACSQPLLAQWFDKKMSFAQGIAMGGSGLGGLILANTTRVLIEKISTKYALIITGSITTAALLIATCLIRKGPLDVGIKAQPVQLHWLWHPGYVWVWIWGFTAVMAYFIALFTIASFATDGIGLSQTEAAAIQSIMAAALMIGRPMTGFALDIGGRLNISMLANVIAGVSCWAFWLPARSFALLAVFAIVHGFVFGSVWSAAASVTAQIAGLSNLGPALAVFWPVAAAPAALANACAIALLEYSRANLGRKGAEAYALSIGFCGALYCLSSLSLYGAKVHHQKSWALFKKA